MVNVRHLQTRSPADLVSQFICVHRRVVSLGSVKATCIHPVEVVLSLRATMITPDIKVTSLSSGDDRFLLHLHLDNVTRPFRTKGAIARHFLRIASRLRRLFFKEDQRVFDRVRLTSDFQRNAICHERNAFPT